tara:strand:- start:18 stop:722 length:705 start_codon:yes stop_codon:yes gene_type:complete
MQPITFTSQQFWSRNRSLNFYSDLHQQRFYVSEIHEMPHYKQNLLLNEAECLVEDLEFQLNEHRDSDDYDWIQRISSKILVTKKFALACRFLLQKNVEEKRMTKRIENYESLIERLKSFMSTSFAIVSCKLTPHDKGLMNAFFLLGQEAINVSRNKQMEYFESYFENCKDKGTLELALEVCLDWHNVFDVMAKENLIRRKSSKYYLTLAKKLKKLIAALPDQTSPCNDPDALAT